MATWRGKRVATVASIVVVVALTGCIDFQAGVGAQASTDPAARSLDVALADVTGDGVADPLAVTSEGHLVRLGACGAACFEPVQSVGAGVVSLAVDDLDADGVQDVVVGTATGVAAYFGGAASTGRPAGLSESDRIDLDTTTLDARVVTGDFDGNGAVDVGAFGPLNDPGFPVPHHTEVMGDGAGGFAAPVERSQALGSGTSVSILGTGDIDGDGDDETFFRVSVAQVGQIYIWVHGDDVDDNIKINVPDLADDVAIGDLDGDGLDDVVVKRFSISTFPGFPVIYWVLRSTGTGFTGFGPGGSVTTLAANPTWSAPDLEIVDLDGDGHADVLATDPLHDGISWWHGQGDGSFTVYGSSNRVDRAAGPGASQVGVEVGAAKPDLLVANGSAANAQVTYLPNTSIGS